MAGIRARPPRPRPVAATSIATVRIAVGVTDSPVDRLGKLGTSRAHVAIVTGSSPCPSLPTRPASAASESTWGILGCRGAALDAVGAPVERVRVVSRAAACICPDLREGQEPAPLAEQAWNIVDAAPDGQHALSGDERGALGWRRRGLAPASRHVARIIRAPIPVGQ